VNLVGSKLDGTPYFQSIRQISQGEIMKSISLLLFLLGTPLVSAQSQDSDQLPEFFSGTASSGNTEPRIDVRLPAGPLMLEMQEDRPVQLVSYYISHVRRLLDGSGDQLKTRLNIDESQVNEIRSLIAAVDAAEAELTTQRVAAMCAEWSRLLVSQSGIDSARTALHYSKGLEITQRSRNPARTNFTEAMTEILGDQNAQLLENHR
jgi:hypothetical protein